MTVEVKTRVITYKVRMVCDKCGNGFMRPTGDVLTVYPLQYPHKCSMCGRMDAYRETYPRIEYVEVEADDDT